jgi:hypothetical protein
VFCKTIILVALNSNVGVTSGLQHDMSALAYDYTTNRWSTTYLGVNTGFDNQFALGDRLYGMAI